MSESELQVSDQKIVELLEMVAGQTEVDDLGHPALALAAVHGYEATEPLGEGGLAEVWHGIDKNAAGRDVAIKVAKRDNPAASDLIAREAEMLARVNTGGVVSVIRQGGVGVDRYLVIDFVEGVALDDHVAHAGTDSEALIDLAVGLCEALQKLHDAGVAHGDIKPWNILIANDGEPVFIDLALAQRLDQPEALPMLPRTRGGTEAYLAPELRADPARPAAVASDLYALGRSIEHAVARSGVVAPDGLTEVLAEACADDPAARPGSAAALAARFDALRPDAGGVSVARRVAVAAGFALVLAGAVAVSIWASRPDGSAVPAAAGVSPFTAISTIMDEHPDEARQALDAIPAEERQWEWRHLWHRATQPPAMVRKVYEVPGVSSGLAPRGLGAVVGDVNGNVRLESTDHDGDSIAKLPSMITHVASPDGQGLIAASADGTLMASRDGLDLKQVGMVKGQPAVAWFDSNQESLFAWDGASGSIFKLDPETGRMDELEKAKLVALAPSAPGWSLRLRSLGEEGGWVLDIFDADGAERFSRELPHWLMPLSVDVDPENNTFVVGFSNGTVWIESLPAVDNQPREVLVLPEEAVTAVALSTEENRLFVAAGKKLMVVDLMTGKTMLTLPVNVKGITRQVAWNLDTGTLSLVTDRGLIQWVAPPEQSVLASR